MVKIFATAPFYTKYVKQITPNDFPSPYIRENPKLWPYFNRALGAIDGSHIHLAAPSSLHNACQNRKGFTSQNCLFACSFDFLFSYSLTGWEGSAADARVYESAIGLDLSIPDGWYLLADAGFPHCEKLLVPYRGVRYHLSEWGHARTRYHLFFFI
jgi:hypothetical protein